MKNFMGYLKNSFNERKYIENVGDMEEYDKECQEPIKVVAKNVDEKFYEDFISYRTLNRRTYLKARAKLFEKKFRLIYLPIALAGLNIFVWFGPKKIKTVTLDNYKKAEFSYDGQVITEYEEDDNYYYSDLGKKFVDPDNKNATTTCDTLTYYIYDGSEGLKAEMYLSEDGKLDYKDRSCEVGFFSDLTKKDASKTIAKTEETDVYVQLFDDIADYLINSNVLSTSSQELLEKLNASDKKKIVINVVDYELLGEKKVDVYSSRGFLKLIFGIMAAIELFVVGFALEQKEYKHYDYLKNHNGRLIVKEGEEDTLLFLTMKYKQAFIDAEKTRVRNCLEKVQSSDEFNLINYENLFTDFEKKKILKMGGNNK